MLDILDSKQYFNINYILPFNVDAFIILLTTSLSVVSSSTVKNEKKRKKNAN